MPICTQCGQQNPDGISRCVKCGSSLGSQMRARADAKRNGVASVGTLLVRIVIAVAVLAAIYPAYRFAGTSYFQYRLNTVKEGANKVCGGPVTPTMQPYTKDTVEKCLTADENLTKAQTDFDNFTHANKS